MQYLSARFLMRIVILISLSCTWSIQASAFEAEAAVDEATQLGVAKVVFPLDAVDDYQLWNSGAPWLDSDRAFYPVTQPPRLLDQLVARLGQSSEMVPREAVIHFLFEGSAPFDIALPADLGQVHIQPTAKPAEYKRLLRGWWRNQQEWLRRDSERSPYPAYLRMYLTNVHSRRMGLRVPKALEPARHLATDERTLDLLSGSDTYRQEIFWQVAKGIPIASVPEQPLPAPIEWSSSMGSVDDRPTIEPMAWQIPENCFYIRFGKYSNLLWLQHLMEEHAADIGRLVTLRSVDAAYGERMKAQLVVDELPFAELIGDKVFADVALVGRDLFFREGAAVALVFQENAPVVGSGLKKMRKKKLEADPRVSAETVEINGEDVSFLSSTDNRVRSFYFARDKFHFITNSRAMMDRFIRVGQGVVPLAENKSFQQGRRKMPLEREDTLFAFFSPQFFQGLLSPQYHIEMQRRVHSRCELDVARLARHAYQHERAAGLFDVGPSTVDASPAGGDDEPTLEDMVRVRLLPQGFGNRADRSRPVWTGDDWADSLRGASGSFLPIPDTPVVSASHEEIADYEALVQYRTKRWDACDPLVVGIQRARHEGQDELEQLTVEAHLNSLNQGKYGTLAKFLGPPSQQELVCDSPLLASLQLSLINRLLPVSDPHFACWGVLEQEPPEDTNHGGLLGALVLWRTAPAFLSVTGDALLSGRLLDRFRNFDEAGYFVGPGGLWRRKHNDFTTLSYQREVLEQVTPELRFVDSNEPAAQVRLQIKSLVDSQLADWMTAMGRDRAQQATLRNVQLLHSLTTQLGVDGLSSRALAEQMVGSQLICPLGGEYEWSEKHNRGHWRSTSWSDNPGEFLREDEPTVPAVLKWCAGMHGWLVQNPSDVTFWAQLQMIRQPDEPKFDFSPLKFFTRPKNDNSDNRAGS